MVAAGCKVLAALGLLWILGACTSLSPVLQTPPPEVTTRISSNFDAEKLAYCFGYSCARQHTVSFPPVRWREVHALFAESGMGAERERQQIRTAIGLMERIAAAQAGTEGDLAGTTPITLQANGPAQLDCYDEAINTSNFLGLLEQNGLLRYHRVRAPVQRWFVGGDYIHATAVIEESDSVVAYAVDGSFHDNGEAGETPLLDAWLAGWAPEDDDRAVVILESQ